MTINNEGKRNPMLIINESLNTMPYEAKYDTWVPVTITLSRSKNEIAFSYDNETITLPHKLSRAGNAQISFGVSPFLNSSSSNVLIFGR